MRHLHHQTVAFSFWFSRLVQKTLIGCLFCGVSTFVRLLFGWNTCTMRLRSGDLISLKTFHISPQWSCFCWQCALENCLLQDKVDTNSGRQNVLLLPSEFHHQQWSVSLFYKKPNASHCSTVFKKSALFRLRFLFFPHTVVSSWLENILRLISGFLTARIKHLSSTAAVLGWPVPYLVVSSLFHLN